MPLFKRSLSARLALAFLVAALLPAGVGLVFFEARLEQVVLSELEAHQSDLARDREHVLAERMRGIERHVEMLARQDSVQAFLQSLGPDPPGPPSQGLADPGAEAEQLIHDVQEILWGATHHLFVADRSGRIVLSPPHGPYDLPCRAPLPTDTTRHAELGSHLGRSLDGKPFFAQALQAPRVTGFFEHPEEDHHHQLVLHPVQDASGRALGVVAAEVAIDRALEALASGVDLGERGQIALTTHTGRRIVHWSRETPTPLASEGLQRAARSGRLSTTGANALQAEGAPHVLGTYLPSQDYPWIVAIETDRAEALASARGNRLVLLQVFALVAIALCLGGTLIGAWFGRPLRQCAQAADRIGGGQLEEPVEVTRGLDEVGILQRAIEAMRLSLLDQIRTLDERVDRKTDELQSALEQARRSEERFSIAVAGSMDGLWDWDLARDEIYFAPRWCELLGVDPAEVGNTPAEWYRRITPEHLPVFQRRMQEHLEGLTDRFDVELEMVHASGETRWMLCRGRAHRDARGTTVRLAGSLAEITELKRAQENVRRLALHDHLTGLPNRELLTQRLRRAMARAHRDRDQTRTYAVLFFDFDRFKVINDSLGHSTGDALLVSIADRFREQVREVDTAARFGGDEFVVLLDGVDGIQGAIHACERYLKVFQEPHHLSGHEVVSTASIGLVVGKPSYTTAEAVLRDADVAMYQAKAAGKARYRAFDDAMFDAAKRRLVLETDLRNADMEREFHLVYQPIVSIDDCRIQGFEALVRWNHPRFGMVPAAEFISVAEETGQIVELGEWILHAACRQLAEWRRDAGDGTPPFVNVNMSRRQLAQPDLLELLESVVELYELEPGALKLEITETTVMDARLDCSQVMQAIRNLGIQLAIDDFGTGQSSLSCLHEFPIDVLKIDRAFIINLETQPEFTAVLGAIVTLAHHLRLGVVAEGIDSPAQLAQLQVMDCEYAQGYLFSPPVAAPEATRMLDAGLPVRRAA